ncbi:MAG: hypothetical protein KDA41_19690, partial [Planctomycetales bacterium]|nr:hypothetical protein [Planctomycetales bacterium]
SRCAADIRDKTALVAAVGVSFCVSRLRPHKMRRSAVCRGSSLSLIAAAIVRNDTADSHILSLQTSFVTRK